MQTTPLLFLLGLSLASCKSVELDLTDLESPVMLNSYPGDAVVDSTASEASYAYTGTASEHLFTHGFNGGGSRRTQVDNAQEAAFTLVGGSETAGITGVQLHLRSSSTYPLLWMSQFIEIKAQGTTREDQ